ncbi:MAG TPA: FkbM family methyltransferase [Solirubrobacteraceae bacterium]|jgi:FkbM family methyltransferase|nr:FkbM family methyltransferase [Solirubrobacteraceae bacterium]
MPPNSIMRRVVKRSLAPLVAHGGYGYIQATAMARDIRRGVLSEPEIDLVALGVREGDTVIDVGANYGMWAYPLSRGVGPTGRVWCFEPIPFTVGALRTIIRLLRMNNVEVVAKGCAEAPGTAQFRIPLQRSGAISAGQAHSADRQDDRPGRGQHVHWLDSQEVACPLATLDDTVPSDAPVSLIKLDIEGAELAALRGATRMIDRHQPTIVCEINPWFLEGFGLRPESVTTFLAQRGYELFRYEQQPVRRLISPGPIVEANYVFVHPKRTDAFSSLLASAMSSEPGHPEHAVGARA